VSFLQQVSVRTRVYGGAEPSSPSCTPAGASARAVRPLRRLAAVPQRFLPRRARCRTTRCSSATRARPARGAAAQGRARRRRPRTWFDLDRLEGGDDYDRKIQANIGRCSYFVPVISANTQRRHEGYFRREWSYAVDRSRNIADGAVFILPVCIDDTAETEALVPEKFRALHISRVPVASRA